MSLTKPLLALTAALGLLGSVGTAVAQTAATCTTDADCQRGYTCQVSAVVGTTEPACPADVGCPTRGTGGAAAHSAGAGGTTGSDVPNGGTVATPPAVDGGTGTPSTGTSEPGSTGTTISTCQPGPCAADSDCGPGMVCHAETLTACTEAASPPCPAGTKCVSDPPVCTSQTVSTCTFKWALPCNADADCGDGFSCQPTVTGSCSGSGSTTGAGNAGGGSVVVVSTETCTTSTSFPGYCRPLATTCAADADCPANWICQDDVVGVGTPGADPSGGASPTTSGTGGAPAAGAGSGVASTGSAADVAPPATTRSCVAPYSALPTSGAGGRTGGSPSSPDPTMTKTGGNDGTSSTGTQGSTSTGGTTAGPPAGGTGTGGSSGDIDSQVDHPGTSGGCSVIPAGNSGGLLAGAGLALALLLARRRRT